MGGGRKAGGERERCPSVPNRSSPDAPTEAKQPFLIGMHQKGGNIKQDSFSFESGALTRFQIWI